MRKHCEMIKKYADVNFINLEVTIKTYDRNALVCGAPAWRYVYHTIHSADKWFFNPFVYDEPEFHTAGMDNPDNPCDIILSDQQLMDYLHKVRDKTLAYMDTFTDEMLYEYPQECPYSRLELVLRQFRHLFMHIGMLNGQTIERTGKFPVYLSPDNLYRLENGLYEE